jgi:Ca2+-binding RTX toxin-like protein
MPPLARGIVTNGSLVDEGGAMHPRVLVSGLAFFGVALLVAVLPLVAQGHTVKTNTPCTITGTSGQDLLMGTPGRDVICGLGGNDTIGAGGGNDVIRAGPGADRIQGDAGRDALLGQNGNDLIWARDGRHDHVNGGRGRDRYRVDGTLDRMVSVEARM